MARISFAELEAVAVVAKQGGFRAAARERGVLSPGLSHAIAALEERLGVRLFNRTTRNVVLTAAGEQFVETISPARAAPACQAGESTTGNFPGMTNLWHWMYRADYYSTTPD